MKRSHLFVLVIILAAFQQLIAVPCDSLVIAGSEVKTYRNGQLINDGFNSYTYDSLGRLSETISLSMVKSIYLYELSGYDSAIIYFRHNGLTYDTASGIFFTNDIYGNRELTYYLSYDTITMQWDTTSFIRTYFSIDSLVRSDSLFIYPNNSFVNFIDTIRDSLERVVTTDSHSLMSWGGSTFIYDSVCIYNVSIKTSYTVIAGPSGSSTSNTTHYYYDSICRPTYSIDTTWNHPTQQNPGNVTTSRTNYYYADCNLIAVAGPDTIATCLNQGVALLLNVYGGTGPYNFVWTGDSLSDHSISNPFAYTNGVSTYTLFVSDSVGNSTSFNQTVILNHFTDSVFAASCASCNDGGVVVYQSGLPVNYILSVSPDSGVWSGNILTGLSAGDYQICSYYVGCTACDSIHIGTPVYVQEIQHTNFIKVFPNPASENVTITISSDHLKNGITWDLIDLRGRIIRANSEFQNRFEISLSAITPGMYFLKFSGYETGMAKIVITR